MPGQKLLRRRQPLSMPFFPTRFLQSSGIGSLTDAMDEFAARANEMMRANFENLGDFSLTRFPAMNVSENKDAYIVTAELPGMTADDVTVDYTDGVLTIRGEKEREESREEDGQTYYLWERRFGSFQRSLPLPGGIADDKIKANFKNGVLHVELPKAEPARKNGKKIPVTNG